MRILLAVIIGLSLTMLANPATAYVVHVTTSIPTTSAQDEAQFEQALRSAIDDILGHAIAFTPTVMTLQNARVVGDRIYILLLIADGDGEETMKQLFDEVPAADGTEREPESPGAGRRF